MQHKGRLPNGARGQSLQEMLMGESGRAVQILSLGWDLQQLAMEKKQQRMKLYWSQHPMDPVHKHARTQRVSHRKTEDTRTHWSTHTHTQLPAKPHKPLSTQTGSQMKALAAHKSPFTARCLPCVCRVSAVWWIRLIRWCLKTLVIPNGAQLIRAARMTFN